MNVFAAMMVTAVVITLVVFVRSIKRDHEATDAKRRQDLEELLQAPENFNRVWLQTGYNDGIEYSYLWAQRTQAARRIMIANTSECKQVMALLNSKGILIHSGPPGTVS